MNSRELLNALSVAERLKDTTRHCYTSKGRHESVAEHSWMMTLMAFFMRDEFPDVDMDKVIRMCIIHDLGECFTGDIPTFDKKQVHEDIEENLLFNWIFCILTNLRTEPDTHFIDLLSVRLHTITEPTGRLTPVNPFIIPRTGILHPDEMVAFRLLFPTNHFIGGHTIQCGTLLFLFCQLFLPCLQLLYGHPGFPERPS